jgi:carbonic anhydrase
VVRQAEQSGRLTLVGMYFDLAEARMYAVDPKEGVLPAAS